MRTNWTKFGLQLGVSQCKLKEFEDERDPFAAVLDYWLAGNIKDAPKDWSTILKVLESNYVDESGLAGKIREKFSIQPENRGKTGCVLHACMRLIQSRKLHPWWESRRLLK